MPGDSELYIAVEKYVSTVEPKPRRFLVAVGTDSTLPDAGRSALQHRGPTFLYPADSAHRTTLQQHLDSLQDIPTLLVSFGGVKQSSGGELQVVLASRYVGGKNAGASHPARAVRFTCDTARWRYKGVVTPASKSAT
ncbi:MAG: hypothetical protein M3081_10635 [Gemmatimonadota bacterium]|nr:hypothetical protein [Gemmatimonadota bacterium]